MTNPHGLSQNILEKRIATQLENSTKYCGQDDPEPESESNESDYDDCNIEITLKEKESPMKNL